MSGATPEVLVFDVNETLLDIEHLAPLFARVFGDERVLREWFNQLVLYSMTTTLSGRYVDFGTLARGVLTMVADVREVRLADGDADELAEALRSMPPHPDVGDGLRRLDEAGFRLATLTNSPPAPAGSSPLEKAGLAGLFEAHFSVQSARAFKPAPQTYDLVAQELGVEPASCVLVAAHAWDIVGAQCAGYSGALLLRAGNAPLPVDGLPRPTLVAADVADLADQLLASRGP